MKFVIITVFLTYTISAQRSALSDDESSVNLENILYVAQNSVNGIRLMNSLSAQSSRDKKIVDEYTDEVLDLIQRFSRASSSSSTEPLNSSPAPDAFMSVPQIIKHHGFSYEEHKVWTPDGNLLTLFRIPSSSKHVDQLNTEPRLPVIIQHGLFCSSSAWVLLEEDSLPFLLARRGHDVWLPNFRGSTYSMEHSSLRSNDVRFWDFGIDEIGMYDVPSIIDYIYKETGESKLNWIGHSMGCASLFVAINHHPRLGDKINKMVAMAPAVYVRHLRSPIFKLISLVPTEIVRGFGNIFAGGRFIPRVIQGLLFQFGPYFCSESPTFELCKAVIFLSVGANADQARARTLGIVGGHLPSEGSMKTLTHYGQFVNAGKFRSYDHGRQENLRRFNSTVAISYSLSKVKFPILVLYGLNDLLVSPQDARRTASELPNVVKSLVVNHTRWSHFDFLYAKDAKSLVYDQSIQFIEDI